MVRNRREADLALRNGARKLKRDRRQPRKLRRAARRVAFAFSVRVAFHWHAPADKHAKALSFGFKWGRYGGVGHGVPAGEWRVPLDDLDDLFLWHDLAFATREQVRTWASASSCWRAGGVLL